MHKQIVAHGFLHDFLVSPYLIESRYPGIGSRTLHVVPCTSDSIFSMLLEYEVR
jgi:hypothetical protein